MKLIHKEHKDLQSKLQSYIQADTNFAKVFAYTQMQFEKATSLTAHNWEHAYRDTLNAIVIGESEGADMRTVLPATAMHDIGFLYGAKGREHGQVGADKLAEFLAAGDIIYSDQDAAKISSCILTHKGSSHDLVPESIEAKVVADADLLEKFGPFGVYQNIRTMTEFNRDFKNSTERFESIGKLQMQTETGKRLAEPGREFVRDFFIQLREAAEPYGEMK